MTSKSDCTSTIVCNPIVVKVQILNHDPRNCSDDAVAAADGPAAANDPNNIRDGQNQQRNIEQRKVKRKRGFKHDENATIYITQEDLDIINSSSSSTDQDDSMLSLSEGMTCRLSNRRKLTTTSAAAQERSAVVSNGIDGNMMDRLWAPVILRVLSQHHRLQYLSSSSNTSSSCAKTKIENGELNTIQSKDALNEQYTPTIFIPPCMSATIGIHWFCRNNTQIMLANIQPLPRKCIVEGSSATVREIGCFSPFMMDNMYNNWDFDTDIITTKRNNSDEKSESNSNNYTTEEEKQLRQFFLSKRVDANAEKEKHLHPSYRTTNNRPLWKPRQRLVTIGSIFATPVISTYCDCYNRMFYRGKCKESIDNVRLYQVVDIQSAPKSGGSCDDHDDDDDMGNDSDERSLLDKSEEELAYIISPFTHLMLQPKQTDDSGLQEYGYIWRLPRPSFILSYLQSIGNSRSSSSSSTHQNVSNLMSKVSKPNAIYHPSAKSLADAIYLQGVIDGTNTVAAFLPYNGPRIIHVIGESENNVRGCIDEAADMMGMRSLHVGGLAAFLVYYNSIYNRDDTRSLLTGGLSDKLKGLVAALEVANRCSPCLLHIEGLDHELTPTTGQMGDASGREEEERRILQVIRDNTSSSRHFISSSFGNSRNGHDVFLSSCTAPKVIVVFSTSDSIPPGPISSSLQQTSITMDPPDTNYSRALWDDDVDGTFESLSASLIGLSARDIGTLRRGFVHEWVKSGSLPDDDVTPISVLEPLLKELEANRSFTQPSREGGAGGSNTLPLATSSLPNVRWEDVGGMEKIRKEIMDAVELPLKYPHFFEGSRRSGILLFGPPGTGKTLVAKAVARECGLPFLSIKGPELLGSYVGESEANIRAVFDAARSAALHSSGSGGGKYSGASVLFFDELDSLAPRRGDTGFGDGVMDRVVSTLLGELDGGETKSSTKGNAEAHVIVIGATNRPDLLDPGLLRPGRFDRLLYLGPAKTKETMLQILKAQTRKFKFEPGVDSDSILQQAMESFPPTLSGADLSAVASKALMRGLNRVCDRVEKEAESLNLNRDPSEMEIGVDDVMESWSKEQLEPVMCVEDFVEAAKSVIPSISQKDLDNFEKLQQQFASR
jgi:AAA+ superfamily predicted ATPase